MNKDINSYQNFRLLGIGKETPKQTERRAVRYDKKKGVENAALGTANLTDEFIKSQQADEKPSIMPFVAIGGLLFVGVTVILILKWKK